MKMLLPLFSGNINGLDPQNERPRRVSRVLIFYSPTLPYSFLFSPFSLSTHSFLATCLL